MENVVAPQADFWNGKKVLVTGHTGFKGAWMAYWLDMMGAQVSGYSLPPPSDPSLYEAVNLPEKLKHNYLENIQDHETLEKAFDEVKPEVVLHLAAQALVRDSYDDPRETYGTNVMGTLNILEAVKKNPSVKSCVIVTTDKCYENKEWYWGYREDDRLGGHDPYSSSKACAEIVTSACWRSFFSNGMLGREVGVATGRAGNVIGGGDWAKDRLIPDFFRSIMNNTTFEVRNPHSIRPWQHVLEAVSGYIVLAEKLFNEPQEYSQSWNFGPDNEEAKPVSWVSDHLIKVWPEEAQWKLTDQSVKKDHRHEAKYLKLDISKAKAELFWAPRLSIEQALEWTVDWYWAFKNKENLHEVMKKQIQSYTEIRGER